MRISKVFLCVIYFILCINCSCQNDIKTLKPNIEFLAPIIDSQIVDFYLDAEYYSYSTIPVVIIRFDKIDTTFYQVSFYNDYPVCDDDFAAYKTYDSIKAYFFIDVVSPEFIKISSPIECTEYFKSSTGDTLPIPNMSYRDYLFFNGKSFFRWEMNSNKNRDEFLDSLKAVIK